MPPWQLLLYNSEREPLYQYQCVKAEQSFANVKTDNCSIHMSATAKSHKKETIHECSHNVY